MKYTLYNMRMKHMMNQYKKSSIQHDNGAHIKTTRECSIQHEKGKHVKQYFISMRTIIQEYLHANVIFLTSQQEPR